MKSVITRRIKHIYDKKFERNPNGNKANLKYDIMGGCVHIKQSTFRRNKTKLEQNTSQRHNACCTGCIDAGGSFGCGGGCRQTIVFFVCMMRSRVVVVVG